LNVENKLGANSLTQKEKQTSSTTSPTTVGSIAKEKTLIGEGTYKTINDTKSMQSKEFKDIATIPKVDVTEKKESKEEKQGSKGGPATNDQTIKLSTEVVWSTNLPPSSASVKTNGTPDLLMKMKNSSETPEEAPLSVSGEIADKSKEENPSSSQKAKTDRLGSALHVDDQLGANSSTETEKQSTSVTSPITAVGITKEKTKQDKGIVITNDASIKTSTVKTDTAPSSGKASDAPNYDFLVKAAEGLLEMFSDTSNEQKTSTDSIRSPAKKTCNPQQCY